MAKSPNGSPPESGEKERHFSLLIVSKDAQLATLLSESLESQGYEVRIALDEETVLAELQQRNFKLIFLDLSFGQTAGLKLLEKLRSGSPGTAVIVLNAPDSVSDRIQYLNRGADDYVTKPFSFQELVARINAMLRPLTYPSHNTLRVEDLELDPINRRVTRAGREIRLSSKEFQLLQILMERAGNEVTRQELLREVWSSPPDSDSNLVDVYVNYLRRKIENYIDDRIDEENKLIHVVRGVGYRIGRKAPPKPDAMD